MAVGDPPIGWIDEYFPPKIPELPRYPEHRNYLKPFDLAWNFQEDGEMLKVQLNVEKVIRETVRHIMELEDEVRDDFLIEYLRSKGHYVVKDAGIKPTYN